MQHRIRSINKQEMTMSTNDMPVVARAVSVVLAVVLVATAIAPLMFVAARVVS